MGDTVRVIQVVETTLTRRGKGVEGDPIRVITEYWSLDGKLLASVDPISGDTVSLMWRQLHTANSPSHVIGDADTKTSMATGGGEA